MALKSYIVEEVALDCADGLLTRREALRRLGLMGLTGAAAATLLAACGDDDEAASSTSRAATSAPDSAAPTTPESPSGTSPSSASPSSAAPSSAPPAVATTQEPLTAGTDPVATSTPTTSGAPVAAAAGEEIRFSGPNGELIGVVAEAPSPLGAVLVIHENRGLTPHIRSIPPRLAADGYTALAIDLLSEEGGTASLPSEGDATAALGNAPADRMIADLRAGLDELGRRAPGTKLAVIGFCFGGGMTWQLLAAGEPRLNAAVPFYGPFPAGADLTGSPNAAVLGIYAELDSRVNGSMDDAEQSLTEAGLTHELRVFDGVDHAFFNDSGQRYDADAAAQAYQAMLDWFGEHLAA